VVVIIVTENAEGLRQKPISNGFSVIKCYAPKPQQVLDEGKLVGALELGISPAAVKVEGIFSQ
jgi:zinc protease